MSIATIIGSIVVGGVILGVGGYFSYQYFWKPLRNYLNYKKEIPRARGFLQELNKRFSPTKLTNEQRETRERAIIESGFSLYALEKAQTTKPSKQEMLVDWFKKACDQGMTIEQAESTLLNHRWNSKDIQKAKKQIFKLNKLEIKNARNKGIKIPSFPAESPTPRVPDLDSGTGIGNGERDGDGEIEHKRILPVSSSRTVERDKPKSQWDWSSFKQGG